MHSACDHIELSFKKLGETLEHWPIAKDHAIRYRTRFDEQVRFKEHAATAKAELKAAHTRERYELADQELTAKRRSMRLK